jgi:hypothetical protein
MTETKAKAKPKRKAPVPKHKRGNKHFWNYRVVRRHKVYLGKDCTWLELVEVHYRDGQPFAFAIQSGAPSVALVNDIEHYADVEGVMRLRETLYHMQAALSLPILDEIEDFKPASKEIKK